MDDEFDFRPIRTYMYPAFVKKWRDDTMAKQRQSVQPHVKEAIEALGNKAKPSAIRDWILAKKKVEVTSQQVSNAKHFLLNGKASAKKKAKKKASPKRIKLRSYEVVSTVPNQSQRANGSVVLAVDKFLTENPNARHALRFMNINNDVSPKTKLLAADLFIQMVGSCENAVEALDAVANFKVE